MVHQKRKKEFIKIIHHLQSQYESSLADKILKGTFPKINLPVLAKQFYIQEKWPSHIAHVYLGLDEKALYERDLVSYILMIIKAENLGVGSKGVPHALLARRFALSVGVSEKGLEKAEPTVQNRALMDWCDMSALERPWIEALAVQIACESQVKSIAKIAKGLKLHYGAKRNDIEFWLVHGGAVERRHSKLGLHLLTKYTSKDEEDSVLYMYEMTCKLAFECNNSILGGEVESI